MLAGYLMLIDYGWVTAEVAYLEPIRNSLQKPIGGRSRIPKRGRVVLADSQAISMLNFSALK